MTTTVETTISTAMADRFVSHGWRNDELLEPLIWEAVQRRLPAGVWQHEKSARKIRSVTLIDERRVHE